MRSFFILGILCLAGSTLHSQNTCGTIAPLANIIQAPDARVAQQLQQFRSASTGVKTLPVIFHVLHSLYTTQAYGTGANVLHQQIVDALNMTNVCLRKQNADTTMIPAAFRALAADCEVQLCLAQVDPQGNPLYEEGVDRVNCMTENIQSSEFSNLVWLMQNHPQLSWDQTKYLNIWITPVYIYNYTGYGMYPDSSGLPGLAAANGTGAANGAYEMYLGLSSSPRLLAHEVGHCLGLFHIWGDANCGNDYCADTPTAAAPNSGCPAFPHITCSNGPDGDMFTNYMDYSYDNCQHQFTYDQKARMQTVLVNSPGRRELPFSTVCVPGTPMVPVADFSNSPTQVCPGGTVQFYDYSGYQPTSWAWSFPGGNPSSSTQQNPVVTYAAPGTYNATLTVSNVQGSNSITLSQVVTVFGAGPNPAFADFENGQLPPPDFQVLTLPFTYPLPTWAIANASAYGIGQKSMAQYSWFLHPVRSYRCDFSATNMPVLKFDYAMAEGSTTGSSVGSLSVQVSTDCANTFTTVLLIPDSVLRTAPPTPNFVPAPNQWRSVTVNLSAYGGLSNVYVQISGVASTDWVYLDNINLYPDPLGVEQAVSPAISMNVYPNPSSGRASVDISGLKESTASLVLSDLSGRVLGKLNVSEGRTALDFGQKLPAGVYFLSLMEGGSQLAVKKWLVE